MLMKLENYGVNGSLLAWFTSYLSGRQQRVVVDGFYSDWLPVTSGVPQGSILGPLLFFVYVNDAPDYIQQNSSIALYADDSKLFRSIKQQTDYTFLQSDLDSLYHWSQDWAMSFSSTKCEVMHFSRKRKPCSHLDRTYCLAGQQLRSVPSIKDLGVTIASDLSWSKHIENITCNANRTLGLVKRVCHDIDDISTRKLLYCSIIRPKLEYASNLWSPYLIKYQLLIENVQRRATRFILNYPKNMPYAERLAKTNILPLQYRREISDLLLLFKSRNGLVTTDVNNILDTFVSPYRTRYSHPNNYNLTIKHKQDYFRKSYFIRSALLWNDLPSDLKECYSLPLFKSKLIKLYHSKLGTYCLPGTTR